MKGSFLYQQIETIFDQHRNEIDQISIIIPNRRASVYIQKYLAEQFKQAFFPPEILTISEWIDQNTDDRVLSSTELLFLLHEIHVEIEKNNAESFDSFMLWGKTILSDFDEIDKYMIDPVEVFKNLKDIKELESWNISADQMGEAQIKFNLIWDKLPEYYNKLELKLKAGGMTYSGRAYLSFLQHLDKKRLKKHTYFLGFNAVSKVEKEIMKKMIKLRKGSAIFEIDKFYYNNEEHEAAWFYRQIVNEWHIKPHLINSFDQHPKTFEIIETSQQTGQAKIAGTYVKSLLENGVKPKDIAVVLADESLLIPLTKSLPAEIETANITMGWPIKFSHLKSFLDTLFEFQFNFEKFKTDQLYHKTLIKFLQHPYTEEITGTKKNGLSVENEITEGNRIFIDRTFLLQSNSGLKKMEAFCMPWPEENNERLKEFELLTEILYKTFKEEDTRRIDLEIIYQFSKGLKKLRNILKNRKVELNLRSFKTLFYQFWQNEALSFFGNPIDGLQVMGILETRTLDFKNLIIIGMNEGNLPRTDPFNSFIPRDLRIFLKMPTEEDRQAVFAHHFYRLLHRSEKVIMTYNSNAEGIGNSERSRYIIQLENEIDKKIHSWQLKTFTGEDEKADTRTVIYKSTPEVHERLDQILAHGLSPSALNKLINCPLDFYYRYILQFDEADEVQENIESSTFGTKIHTVLQRIIEENFGTEKGYSPLDVAILEKEKDEKKIRERLLLAYQSNDGGKIFKASDLKYGQNKLSFDISVQFIKSFLEQQIKELQRGFEVTPLNLEIDIEAEFSLKISGSEKLVKFYGKADRIDSIGDHFRILDYKSGSSEDNKLTFPSKPDFESVKAMLNRNRSAHVRQLMMYGTMFRQSFKDRKPFSAGIISMVKIGDWIHYLSCGDDILLNEEVINFFEKALLEKIGNLYDPEFEFKHDPDSKYCLHCEK